MGSAHAEAITLSSLEFSRCTSDVLQKKIEVMECRFYLGVSLISMAAIAKILSLYPYLNIVLGYPVRAARSHHRAIDAGFRFLHLSEMH
jgi:hypothetical protein